MIAEIEPKARMREQLRVAAHQWQDRARPDALLWRGEVLADLERWMRHTTGAAPLGDLEMSFVAASAVLPLTLWLAALDHGGHARRASTISSLLRPVAEQRPDPRPLVLGHHAGAQVSPGLLAGQLTSDSSSSAERELHSRHAAARTELAPVLQHGALGAHAAADARTARRGLWLGVLRAHPAHVRADGLLLRPRGDPTHYFPFGGGTRRCLGMAFATFEMKIVLATILARVDLAAASDRVRLVRRGITLAPSGGMPVVARPR